MLRSIRFEGQEADPGDVNEDGTLTLDENGNPVRLPRPALPAWPKGCSIDVKSTPSIGDYEMIEKLRARSRAAAQKLEAGEDVDDEDAIFFQPVIYGAVLLRGFTGPAFHDPETGAPRAVPQGITPEDIRARANILRELPAQVLGPFDTEVAKVINDPLPGMETVSDSAPVSAPISMDTAISRPRRSAKSTRS